MKRRVVWSLDALRDIGALSAYIATDNPHAARRIAASLRKAGNNLGNMATGRRGRVGGTYEKVVPKLPYIVVYALVASDGHEVVSIVRVIHGARDWPEDALPD